MTKFWSDHAYEFYKRACDHGNYPEVPFCPMLRKLISPNDVVADIGCGFGITSLYLAKLCRQVLAIDQDPYALKMLREQIELQKVRNIQTLQGTWPNLTCEDWDIAIGIYHHHFANDAEKVNQLIAKTRKGGLICTQGTKERESFHLAVAKKLELPEEKHLHCSNGCYVRGRLEQAGLKVQCTMVAHDFDQPVTDQAEAVRFILDQMKLDDQHYETIANSIDEYTKNHNGTLLVPIRRYNCVLIFEK